MKKLEKIDELEAICAEHTRQIGLMEAEQERAKAEFAAYKVDVAEKTRRSAASAGRSTVAQDAGGLRDEQLTVTTDQQICLHADGSGAAAKTKAGGAAAGAAAATAAAAAARTPCSRRSPSRMSPSTC